MILGVLSEAPGVCKDPAPSVYLVSYGDFAVNFTIKFFLEEYDRLDPIQSGVMDRLWYAFRREDISIPYPIRDVRHRDKWFVENASRKRVKDDDHFEHLMNSYLPSHGGWKWREDRELFR